ncbi:MAG TPA: PfkB family carbohydrate kinase [Methylomirabilota bacterium]|nr:PfkB family carbohydrate kinase [Methylomirabilota bacterium]
MDLVAIGHVTFDETPSGVRPGGSAYYVALTAQRLGLEVGVLTSIAPDFPRDVFPAGIHIANVSTERTTRYRVGGSSGSRTLTLLSRAEDIEVQHIPHDWTSASLGVLCPVAGEVDPALVGVFDDASLAVLPQGWMRARGKGGVVIPQPWEDADDVLPMIQLLVLSEEDVPGSEETAVKWFQQVPLGAITRARRGATLYVNGEPYHVEADRANEIDPTGAGDVFATTLFIEYQRVGDAWDAAAAAACAGAAVVEGTGASTLLDRAGLAARVAAYQRRFAG